MTPDNAAALAALWLELDAIPGQTDEEADALGVQ
jgi:hypothetical protein